MKRKRVRMRVLALKVAGITSIFGKRGGREEGERGEEKGREREKGEEEREKKKKRKKKPKGRDKRMLPCTNKLHRVVHIRDTLYARVITRLYLLFFCFSSMELNDSVTFNVLWGGMHTAD